jgi:hypothetical protein
MQIDWTTLSYTVIVFFAVIGFFRGWWKEAITTFFLSMLVLLLQHPDWAETIIDWLNRVIEAGASFLNALVGFPENPQTFLQFDASRPGTWLIILFFMWSLSALIGWLLLPGTASKTPSRYYVVTFMGRLFGVLLGAVNGFLIINLVREYLDGRSLPGNTALPTEITAQGASATGPAMSTLTIQAVNLPSMTILDSYIPWLIIATGIIVLAMAAWSRVRVERKTGAGSRIVYPAPYGYKPVELPKTTARQPREVRVIP